MAFDMDKPPRDARIFRPFSNAQRNDHIRYAWSHDADEGNGDHHIRKSQYQIDQSRQPTVNAWRREACQSADNDAYRSADADDGESNPQRCLPAIKDAGPHIAAQLIGSEPMSAADILQPIGYIRRLRIIRRYVRSAEEKYDPQHRQYKHDI